MSSSLLALVVLLGLAHVATRAQGLAPVAGALKALPIALLAAVTLRGAGGDGTYRTLVGLGLVASMGGDLFLLSRRGFVPGLLCFLVAHLLYITAFAPAAPGGATALVLLLPFLGFAAAVLRILWPHLGRHRAPVCLYVATITAMGWLATVRALGGEVAPESGLAAMAGAFAFMASDTALAMNRFVRPFGAAETVIMSTYYAAQILLALSAAP